MKYVNMNEVAFDADSIVFPGLGNCHGVVYVNEAGLFAFHNYGAPKESSGRIGAFGMFVRNHVSGRSKGICLYGACPSNRHQSDTTHKAELQLIADALKFNGKMKACRWDLGQLGWSTTYTEFRHHRTVTSILIEDFTGGTDQRGPNLYPFDHKQVFQQYDRIDKSKITSSSCKVKEKIITSVVRPKQSTNRQVRAWKL